MAKRKFNAIIPAHIKKNKDGDLKIYGLASTDTKDLEGEIINVEGLDTTMVEKGRAYFNWDHKQDPENTLGVIDSYKKDEGKLYLGGTLFKNHDRAKAVHQIMTSLDKSDERKVGMSIEGTIEDRKGINGEVIDKAVITNCALTLKPVNTDTYVNLAKSLSSVKEIDFENARLNEDKKSFEKPEPIEKVQFSTEQVFELLSEFKKSIESKDKLEKACKYCGKLPKECPDCGAKFKKAMDTLDSLKGEEVQKAISDLHEKYPETDKEEIKDIFAKGLLEDLISGWVDSPTYGSRLLLSILSALTSYANSLEWGTSDRSDAQEKEDKKKAKKIKAYVREFAISKDPVSDCLDYMWKKLTKDL